MKKNIKEKIFQNPNKALQNPFQRFKNLLFNKDNKEIKEENEFEEQSINSFKKRSFKSYSKLNHYSNYKKPIKTYNNNYFANTISLPNEKKQNRFFENSNKKSFSRNQENNKGLDSINNNSTDINSKIFTAKKTISDNAKNQNNSKNFCIPIKRNAINFIDRNKLKATQTVNLKLYEKFEEELDKLKSTNKLIKIKMNDIHFLDTEGFLMLNSLPNIKKESSFEKKMKKKKKYISDDNKRKDVFQRIKKDIINDNNNNIYHRKYPLKKLMELNPYHSVPKNVKYCNLVDIKKISEQLSHVTGIVHSREVKNRRNFFKGDMHFTYNKHYINSKIINSVTVTYNNDYSWRKGELVWRILNKLERKTVSSSFRQACIFQGYSELWKYYSMVLEKLLVNFPSYKWFITKNKFMKKDVFTEFLQYIDINIKENKTFPDKVYLLFGDDEKETMNIKVFYFIMELISSSSKSIEKINFILELFEDNNKPNTINVMEMQEILKTLILHENYLKDCSHLHETIKNEFNKEKIESDFYITKAQLFNFLINNEFLKKLILLFKNQLKNAYYYYNEEIMGSFNSTIRNAKKFLNEQNEVNRLCKHDIYNYEEILKALQNKRKILENNRIIVKTIDGSD